MISFFLNFAVIEPRDRKRHFRNPLRRGVLAFAPTLDLFADADQRVRLGHFERQVERRAVVERIDGRIPACARADCEISAARVFNNFVALILDCYFVLAPFNQSAQAAWRKTSRPLFDSPE